jgi:MFS family permease
VTRFLTAVLILAAQAPGELDPEAGEYNLFLFCFLVIGLVALAALAALAVIGIVVGIMVAVTGGAMVVSGAALSSSIAAAARRSPQTGLMWFVVQMSFAGGAVSGFAVGALYSSFHQLPVLNWTHSGLAALIGAGTSAAIGWIPVKLWLRIWRQFQQWWQQRGSLKNFPE